MQDNRTVDFSIESRDLKEGSVTLRLIMEGSKQMLSSGPVRILMY